MFCLTHTLVIDLIYVNEKTLAIERENTIDVLYETIIEQQAKNSAV
jgi:hypothetical protein